MSIAIVGKTNTSFAPLSQSKPSPVTSTPEKHQSGSPLKASDRHETQVIQKGMTPTLKGAGAGLLGGAAALVLPVGGLMGISSMGGGSGGGLAVVMAGVGVAIAGGAAGAVGGAVAANFTDNKGTGALIGAGSGALTGALALGAVTKGHLFGTLFGAVVGGAIGAAGGAAGSLVAKPQ